MKIFAEELIKNRKSIRYVESSELVNSQQIAELLCKAGIDTVHAIDPNDEWLKRRLQRGCAERGIQVNWVEDPAFLTSFAVQKDWLGDRQ